MTQLLDIFGFLSVLLRGLTLAFEALTVGGVFFVFFLANDKTDGASRRKLTRMLVLASLALATVQLCYVAANGAILIGSTDLTWSDIAGAGFTFAGALTISGALVIAIAASRRRGSPPGRRKARGEQVAGGCPRQSG